MPSRNSAEMNEITDGEANDHDAEEAVQDPIPPWRRMSQCTSYHFEQAAGMTFMKVWHDAFQVHLFVTGVDKNTIFNDIGQNGIAIVQQHILLAAYCVVCKEMYHWALLSKLGQLIARQALSDALRQHATMQHSSHHKDPGRIVCMSCATWKQTELAHKYLERLEQAGAISVDSSLSIQVEATNISLVHDQYGCSPFSLIGTTDLTASSIWDHFARAVSHRYHSEPSTEGNDRLVEGSEVTASSSAV